MSFLSEEESNRRLNDPRNVLSRVDRDNGSVSHLPEPMTIIPSVEDSAVTNETKLDDGEELPAHPQQELRETTSEDSSPDQSVELSPEISDAVDALLTPRSPAKVDIDPILHLKMIRAIESGSDIRRGRKTGIRNRTLEENASIGLTSLLLGSKATEGMTGVQQPQQSNITRGFTSPNDAAQGKAPKDELLDEIYSQGRVVTNLAFKKLVKSLELIDDDKLQKIQDPLKLVSAAKNLSGIVKDMTPKEGNVNEGGVHFHIYRPEQNEESHYDVVEVGGDGSVTVQQL